MNLTKTDLELLVAPVLVDAFKYCTLGFIIINKSTDYSTYDMSVKV